MANFNFNKVLLGGRLSAAPELKSTPSGVSVTSFSIAVNRRTKGEEQKADFIDCTAWRHTAEFITRYFRKGASIFIVGSVQTRNWTDSDGKKHYVTEIVVDEAYFVDSKGERTAPATAAPPPSYIPTSYMPDADKLVGNPYFEEIGEDEDLPF